MYIRDILDEQALQQSVTEGLLYEIVDSTGQFRLYHYTPRTQYERQWTRETRLCRGLIVDTSGRIVCFPFPKFFNLNEMPETAEHEVAARGAFTISEKLDGSLINVWWADNAWHVTTRKRFENTHITAARQWLTQHAAWFRDSDSTYQQYTLMFEWVAPENRIVLTYAHSELLLIGACHLDDRHDLDSVALLHLGTALQVRCPQIHEATLATLSQQAADTKGIEGWVLRWPDGFRVKVKTAEYVALHRLITQYSPKRVWEAYCAGVHTDYLLQLPDELQSEAQQVAAQIDTKLHSEITRLTARSETLPKSDRKTYALAVLQEPETDRPYLFALYDKRIIRDMLLRQIGTTLSAAGHFDDEG